MKSPTVSVVIPVFNAERYLDQAIESISTQTLKDIEILLIDDRSTDGSVEICKRHARNDSRIQTISRNENGGIAKALNDGLRVARGQFIARMDADDIAMPSRLQDQLAYMSLSTDVGVCGTAYEVIDEHGNTISRKVPVTDAARVVAMLRFCSPIAHPTWMMRREVVSMLGGYRDLAPAEDYDFLMRVVGAGWKVNNIRSLGLKYRVSSSSTSSRGALRQRLAFNYVRQLHAQGRKFDRHEYVRMLESRRSFEKVHQLSETWMNKAVRLKHTGKAYFIFLALCAVLISPYQMQFVFRSFCARWIGRGGVIGSKQAVG